MPAGLGVGTHAVSEPKLPPLSLSPRLLVVQVTLWTTSRTKLTPSGVMSEAVPSGHPGGWYQATLPSPVPVQAGSNYMVAYHSGGAGFGVERNVAFPIETPQFSGQDERSVLLGSDKQTLFCSQARNVRDATGSVPRAHLRQQ